jgi:hypothetical protein
VLQCRHGWILLPESRSEVVQCKLTGIQQLILDFHRSHLHRAYLTEKASPLRPSRRANRQESKSNKNVSSPSGSLSGYKYAR